MNITDEMKEAERERQAIARENFLKSDAGNPDAQNMIRARETEKSLKLTLAQIKKDGGVLSPDSQKVIDAQIAEALAEQGKFRQAARAASDEEMRSYYRRIDTAVRRDDGDSCDCEPERRDGGLVIPNKRILMKVFSEKHMKLMNLVECVICRHWNVQPLDAALEIQAQNAAKAEKIAHGADGFINIQAALTANKLSDTELLK